MSAADLLSRLERVKQTGAARWLACCPSHQDRTPSLSVRELDDGRVLVNCFAGCGALEVLGSIGLHWSALFPPKLGTVTPSHSRIPARDWLEILDHEVTVAALILLRIA